MSGYQPESQMLELWSSHRRRMVYTVRPAEKRGKWGSKHALRYWIAIPIVVGLVAMLSGCVVYPHRHGYHGGYGRGYGYGDRYYGRGYGYNGYGGGGGGWHHRHHHDDDDD